jgi:hypothetical protein
VITTAVQTLCATETCFFFRTTEKDLYDLKNEVVETRNEKSSQGVASSKFLLSFHIFRVHFLLSKTRETLY